jgi:type IV secretory pathway VirD2 relaxase
MTESEDLRAFIRDLMARFDRGMDGLFRQVEASREETRQHFEEIKDQNRAQEEALFRILDRLNNGGPAAEPG